MTEWEHSSSDQQLRVPKVLKVWDKEREGYVSVTGRACPKCHCLIPEDFYSVSSSRRHIVALSGCTSAGKTQFMLVALHDLMKLGRSLQLCSIEIADCSKIFYKSVLSEYEERGGTDATNVATRMFPILFRVRAADKNIPDSWVSLYDCAGEYARDSDYALNQEGLKRATELLLLVDPHQVMDGVKRSDNNTNCTEFVENALIQFQKYESLGKELKHITAVLTKFDLILDTEGMQKDFPRDTGAGDGMLITTHDMGVHKEAVNRKVLETISKQLLTQEQLSGLLPEIQKHAGGNQVDEENILLLGCSTFTWTSDGRLERKKDTDGKWQLDGSEADRHRVIEPLLAVLSNIEAVAVKGTDDEPSRGRRK